MVDAETKNEIAANLSRQAEINANCEAPPLVDRLRQYVQIADGDKMTVIFCDDLIEAADEIERLRRASA